MAKTYRQRIEEIAETAARKTLNRAGVTNPTPEQQRTAQRCAMRHTLKELADTRPDFLHGLHAELAAARPLAAKE